MTSQTDPQHLFGEPDSGAGRYSRGVSRYGRWIAVAAVLLGVATSLVLGSKASTTVVQVTPRNVSSSLADLDLDDFFVEFPSNSAVIDFLNGLDGTEGFPTNSVSAAPEATVGRSVVVTSTAGTTGAADQLSASVISRLEEWVQGERQAAVSDFATIVDEQRIQVEARRAELDAMIDGLESSEALSDALLDERSDMSSTLIRLDGADLALEAFGSNPSPVELISTTQTNQDSRPLWFVVGAMGGAIVGLIVVIALAHLDRSVRTLAELQSIVGGETPALVPRAGAEAEVARRSLAARLVQSGGDRPIVIVSVDEVGSRIAGEISGRVPGSIVAGLGDLDVSSNETCLVVAVSGTTDADDLRRARSYLAGLGYTDVSCALVDVRARDLRSATA